MSAIRLLLVLLLVAGFVLFAVPNWTPATLVFGSTEVITRLPLVVLAGFLLAFVPMSLTHRWARRRWQSRLHQAVVAVPPVLAKPCPPSLGQPTIVPPAGA